MKKQTAVHWLLIAMTNKLSSDIGPQFLDLFDQALAMEKEQMIQSFRKGAVVNEPEYYTWIESAYRKEAEKYYNETYGN
jgi:hypothetical protein